MLSKEEQEGWARYWIGDLQSEMKILMIGDSVTHGYTDMVAEHFNKKGICVGKYTTPKDISNPNLITDAETMLGKVDVSTIRIVHINNGLHGWKTPTDQQNDFFRQRIDDIHRLIPGADIILVNTTPVIVGAEKEQYVSRDLNDMVIGKNAELEKLGKELNYTVEDLYSEVFGRRELRTDDFHFNHDGYAILAEKAIASLEKEMEKLHSLSAEERKSTLCHERAEWSQIWIGNTNLKDMILLLGDSITNGYSGGVEAYYAGRICVAKHVTSKSVGNPFLIKEVKLLIEEYGADRFKIIHVNNGLHGGGLSDEDYEKYYRLYLYELMTAAPDSNFILSNCTPYTVANTEGFVPSPANEAVERKNKILEKIGADLGFEVEDLYSVVYGNGEIRSRDGVHYNPAGYELLSAKVIETLERTMRN